MTLQSIRTRAVIALGLTVGFYLLAVVLVVLLVSWPIAEAMYTGRLHVRLALYSLGGAGLIAFSILPRRDRFVPPGPEISRTSQPDLVSAFEGIAGKAGQRMPRKIYVIPEANAWVMQRGGFLGLGSKRLMGVGFPLLGILSRNELLAVIAHEFGHYANADTRLGRWVYRTRAAISRSVENVRGLLQIPFMAYARLFMWITAKVSRSQEFAADAFAASIAGPGTMVAALQKLEMSAPAFDLFWSHDLEPIASNGWLPPVMEGLRLYTSSERISDILKPAVEARRAQDVPDPYDSHPPTSERIEALRQLPHGEADDDGPAYELIRNPRGLEKTLLQHVFARSSDEPLQEIRWEQVGAAVLVPAWQSTASEHAGVLSGISFEALPDVIRNPGEYARQFVRLAPSDAARDYAVQDLADRIHADGMLPEQVACPSCGNELTLTPATRQRLSFGCVSCGDAFDFRGWVAGQRQAFFGLVGSTLAADLASRGWAVDYVPGQAIALTLDSDRIEPFELTGRLVAGTVTPDEWQQVCEVTGWSGRMVPTAHEATA